MLSDLMVNLFPPGGDLAVGVIQLVMWFVALLTLAAAIFGGLIRLLNARQPRPIVVRAITRPAARL